MARADRWHARIGGTSGQIWYTLCVVGMVTSILMYLLPALGVVLIARAYWRMERDEQALRAKHWEEFRRGDERPGVWLIRAIAWVFVIWPVLLLSGVLMLVGLVMVLLSMEWERAPWRLPLTWILVTAGLCAWVFGKNFDPANGRRRCPKCWYDYSALGGTDKCPECGHEPRNLAELRKARPSRGWMMAAPALLVLAYLAHVLPIVARTSWRSFVPTDVLIWGYDVLPETLIVGNHEPGSLVDRLNSRHVTGGQFHAINELGTWRLAHARDAASLDRACELMEYADWALSREVLTNVPRTLADEMRATGLNPAVDARRLGVILRSAGVWSSEMEFGWRDGGEAYTIAEMVAAGPLQSCSGVLVIGLAILPPEDEEFLQPLVAAATERSRPEEERVASAMHFGYIAGELALRHPHTVAAWAPIEAGEPVVRYAAEIASREREFERDEDGYVYDEGVRADRGMFAAAREAMKSGDAVRARAAVLVLRRAIAQGLVITPDVQRISELDGAAREFPELRGEAFALAGELGLAAAGFDDLIREGLASTDLARRREALALVVQTPDGHERYGAMIEQMRVEAEADPARAEEARSLRSIWGGGGCE